MVGWLVLIDTVQYRYIPEKAGRHVSRPFRALGIYLADISIAPQPKQQCISSKVNGRSKSERCTGTMTDLVRMPS